MDDILTAVKTARKDDQTSLSAAKPLIEPLDEPSIKQTAIQVSPAHILETLKTNPGEDELYQTLRWLDPTKQNEERGSFDIRHASPLTAPILQTLASYTIPDHWKNVEKSSSKTRGAMLRCLCSVAGVRALVTSLQISINALRTSPQKEKDSGRKLAIQDTVSFLAALLKPVDFIHRIYRDNASMYETSSKRRVSWLEFCSLLAGGKVLSSIAEALSFTDSMKGASSISWVGEGVSFSGWLGLTMSHMVLQGGQKDDEFWKAASLMIGRAMGLGHTDKFIHELYINTFEDNAPSRSWHFFFDLLRPLEQVAIVQSILKDLQTAHFGSYESKDRESNLTVVGGVAALLSHYIEGKACVQETIQSWLSTGNSNVVTTVGLRRVLLLLYSKDSNTIRDIFTQSLSNFGDAFNIKHSLLQFQEANAQILLLAAGYLHRSQPTEVENIARSSIYLNAVSNRLAASSSRARFLGMVVGMAISELVEAPGKGLKFDLEDLETKEAQWYLNLTRVQDRIGSISDLKRSKHSEAEKPKQTTTNRPRVSRPSKSVHTRPTARIVAIEEIEDDEDENEEDDEFIPYERPDSDASDTEEDPTLIQRGKPTAPVYIRDLIAYLKDSENADRYQLGITTASSLIRRKAAFGTELVESIDGLAMVVVGLQDTYSLPKFHEYRLQAMIALLVAQPVRMGQLFTATFFDGDLSQTQRSAILTALGLGARELAGHREDDAKVMGLASVSQESFPSRKLPGHLQGLYSETDEESPVSALTRQMSRTSLQPLALDAADAASGPNALKVRTFSSRMEVERQRQQREAQRKKKTISTNLHKDLTEGFFHPLVGRFAAMLQSSSSLSSGYSHFNSPNILRLFVQTITLVISTLGPHSPALPTVTQDTLTLILALHGKPISTEPVVLPALLSLLLASIDLNTAAGSSAEERLVTDHATEVMELREWTNDIFERTPAASGSTATSPEKMDDMQQTRMLAAGILVKIGEVVERYQRRLMGVSVGFKY